MKPITTFFLAINHHHYFRCFIDEIHSHPFTLPAIAFLNDVIDGGDGHELAVGCPGLESDGVVLVYDADDWTDETQTFDSVLSIRPSDAPMAAFFSDRGPGPYNFGAAIGSTAGGRELVVASTQGVDLDARLVEMSFDGSGVDEVATAGRPIRAAVNDTSLYGTAFDLRGFPPLVGAVVGGLFCCGCCGANFARCRLQTHTHTHTHRWARPGPMAEMARCTSCATTTMSMDPVSWAARSLSTPPARW